MSGGVRTALGTLGTGLRQLLAVRWVRVVASVLALSLLARAGLEFMLARALDRVAAPRELEIAWRHLDLALLSGRGELRFLEVRPRAKNGSDSPPEDPILTVDYAVFDLELLPLLVGDLRVRRAEVDGLDAFVERDAAGRWSLERHMPLDELLAWLEQPQALDEQEPRPLHLQPPVAIEALRLQDARLHLTDAATTPASQLTLEVDAALSGLRTSDGPARFSATLTAPGVLDGARVSGDAQWTPGGLRVDLRGQMGGLRPAGFGPWLATLDLAPAAQVVGGSITARLELEVIGPERDALRIGAALSEVRLTADGAEILALDRLDLEAESVSAAGARLRELQLSGVRGQASLEASGALRIAGLELLPQETRSPDPTFADSLVSALELWNSEALPRWATLLVRHDPDAYPWSLGRFAVSDGAVEFVDRRITPAGEFSVLIHQIEVGTVAHTPTGDAPPIPIDIRLGAPGLAESIRLHGELDPFAPQRALDLTLELDGIGMTAIEGYLTGAGLESTMANGNLRAHLAGAATTDATGRTTGWIEFDRLALQEGQDLLRLGSIAAHDLAFDPGARSMRIGDVEVSGLHLAFGRDPSNRIVALGLRTLALAPSSAPAQGGSASGTALPPLHLEVGRFAWTDSELAFTDTLSDPPRRIALEQLGFELTNLSLGGRPSDPVPEPAHFSAHAVAPEIFERFSLEGTVHSRPGAIDLTGDLTLSCEGLEGALIAPYARALGIEPTIAGGKLSAGIVAALREDAGWRGGLTVTKALFADEGGTIAELGELAVEDVHVAEAITVGSVSLRDASLALARDSAGNLVIGGVRVLDAPAATPHEDTPATVSLAWPELPELRIERVQVSNAQLTWTDATFDPSLDTRLRVEADARGLSTAGEAGTFSASLQVPETLEALRATGSIELSSAGLRMRGAVTGEGLAPGPLTRMLPAGVSLEDAAPQAFTAEFSLEAADATAGGLSVQLEARDFALRTGEAPPSVSFERLVLAAPRIDPGRGAVELGPLALEGLELSLTRDRAGRFHGAGLVLSPQPSPGAELIAEDTAAPRLPVDLPRIELVERLSLELRRMTLADATLGSSARPLEAHARFETGPAVLISAEPLDLPPLAWELEAGIEGLIESGSLVGTVAPFAAEPRFEASLRARGLRTAGLVELAPALFPGITGVVEDGELSGQLDASWFVRRARPTDLGFSRPFGAELVLSELALRDAPDGQVLAGVDEILVEIKRIDPASGDVHAELLEVHRPHALVTRRGNRLSAFGLQLDLEASAEATAIPATSAVPAAPAASAASRPPRAGSELRLDTLLVTGLDLRVRDDTTAPPLELALTELDLEVKQLSTKALEEPRPILFSAVVGSGPEGVLEEIAVSGRVALFPELSGWITASLSGLELPPLAGLAREQGLDIEDGALDASLRVRLNGSKGAHVSSSIVFSDLALDEAKGGPVESGLALPMALNSALFILRNANGEHRFSVSFDADEDGVSRGQLAKAGAQAFAGVLARALASAPLRLLGGLLPTTEATPEPSAVYTVGFAAAHGDLMSLPDALVEARRRLASDGEWVAVVRHELSAEDALRAERMANPTASECAQLARRLQQRKSELLRRRAELAASARTLFAVGAPEARDASEQLRELARELAGVEDGLDQILEILRSDSPRQREKRTRAACREIAEQRLEATRLALRPRTRNGGQQNVELLAPRFEVVERAGSGGGRVVIELRRR